jgi:hypothetical protein
MQKSEHLNNFETLNFTNIHLQTQHSCSKTDIKQESYNGVVGKPWISNDKVFLYTFECSSKINTLSHFLLSDFVINTVWPCVIVIVIVIVITPTIIDRKFIVKAFVNIGLTFPDKPESRTD